MSGGLAVLSKPVGPMPLGAWLVVGAGGLFLAWRAQDSPPAATLENSLTSSSASGEIDSADNAPAIVNVVVYTPEQTSSSTTPTVAPVVHSEATVAHPILITKPVVKPAAPVVPVKGPVARRTHTVVPGDTLSAIARSYGITRWDDIYQANTGVIERTARSHGRVSSDHGHWIYPGEILVIP